MGCTSSVSYYLHQINFYTIHHSMIIYIFRLLYEKKHSQAGSYFIRFVAYFHNIKFLSFIVTYDFKFKRSKKCIVLRINIFAFKLILSPSEIGSW